MSMLSLRDPGRRTTALAVLLVACGLGAVLAAWSGAAATSVVTEQVAFLTSGGAGGLALVGTGLAILDIQRRRYESAAEARELEELTSALTSLAVHVATTEPGHRRPEVKSRRS